MTFEESLKAGRAGESAIARWLRCKGWGVLPVYEKIIDEGKGPQLFLPKRTLIAPDLFGFKEQTAYWIEAKTKSDFTWHRNSQRWTTGIDLRHYLDYCEVDDATPFPVWLMFLQKGEGGKDNPEPGPTGLFGNRLSCLRRNENHRSDRWGRSGMVYWSLHALIELAPLSEVLSPVAAAPLIEFHAFVVDGSQLGLGI